MFKTIHLWEYRETAYKHNDFTSHSIANNYNLKM